VIQAALDTLGLPVNSLLPAVVGAAGCSIPIPQREVRLHQPDTG
jgi:hypothetical protein